MGRGDGVFSGKQHSKFDPQDRGLSRAQKLLQRFFPEKQLIVRSGERMESRLPNLLGQRNVAIHNRRLG